MVSLRIDFEKLHLFRSIKAFLPLANLRLSSIQKRILPHIHEFLSLQPRFEVHEHPSIFLIVVFGRFSFYLLAGFLDIPDPGDVALHGF